MVKRTGTGSLRHSSIAGFFRGIDFKRNLTAALRQPNWITVVLSRRKRQLDCVPSSGFNRLGNKHVVSIQRDLQVRSPDDVSIAPTHLSGAMVRVGDWMIGLADMHMKLLRNTQIWKVRIQPC